MLLLGAKYIVKIFFCQPFVKNFAKNNHGHLKVTVRGPLSKRHRAWSIGHRVRTKVSVFRFQLSAKEIHNPKSEISHLKSISQIRNPKSAIICLPAENAYSQFLNRFDTTDYGPLTTDNLEEP
jgi:hypothetical protein